MSAPVRLGVLTDIAHRVQQGIDIIEGHYPTRQVVDNLGTGRGVVDDGWGATGQGLSRGHAEGLRLRGVHIDIGIGIVLHELLFTVRATDTHNPIGELAHQIVGETHERDIVVFRQAQTQATEGIESLALLPDAGHSEDLVMACAGELVLVRVEHIDVDAVIDTTRVDVLQDRLAHLGLEVFRHRDQMEVGDLVEVITLLLEVLAGACKAIAARILLPGERTVDTLRLPLFTGSHHREGTVACEGPHVVEGPHHRRPLFGEVLEQGGIVQVIPVYVVDMDDIGVDIIDLTDESPRGIGGTQAMAIEEHRLEAMAVLTEGAPNFQDVGLAGVGIAAIGHIALPPLGHGSLTDTLDNPAVRAPVGRYINLKQFRHK